MARRTAFISAVFPAFLVLACLFPGAQDLEAQALSLPGKTGMVLPAVFEGEAETLHLPSAQALAGPAAFSLETPQSVLVDNFIKKYATPEGLKWLRETMERGRPYRSFIVKSIEERSLPPELLFLPVVESEFRPGAVSTSGAVGLWQFMLNSISPVSMKVNEWQDDRRDFWKATEAAMDKLAYNYGVLGDWLLALGAYNCGLNRMLSIIKTAGIKDFWQLAEKGYLPSETLAYVPKFIAVTALMSYPGRYGLPPSWDADITWERVRLDFPVDLGLLASESGMPLDLLKAGNRELNYAITPPDVPYFIKVPGSHTGAVKTVLSQDRLKLMKFYIHTIRAGDTLYDMARHFGVSVGLILSYNPGARPEALQLGARLLVPSVREVGPYPGRPKAAEAPLPEPTGSFTGTYLVQKGDTLWSISKRYETSAALLASENRIALTGVLSIGQVLYVPPAAQNGVSVPHGGGKE